ncbi:MAG: hypothetical protein NWF07_09855 [Candidatus Bathyarchaeota archaeon]|nr:hypothetical protein [Candidatus Bathyarchaeota archaeon]
MRRDYLRNAVAILAFSLVTSAFMMFNLNLDNMGVYLYLKLISFGVVPATICFSWLYLWRNEPNPFMFLSNYNSLTQALFVVLNLIRVPFARLGFFGSAYILLSIALIIVYQTNWAYSKIGFFISGGLILLNVVFAFGLIMTTFEHVHPFFLDAGPGLMAVSDFITEVSVMGSLLVASSQLYWHEILKTRREQEMIERIFAELDAED